MSNWQYAQVVPTEKWRSAMTIPRDLGLVKVGEKYLVTSRPVPELTTIEGKTTTLQNIAAANYDLTEKTGKLAGPARLDISTSTLQPFIITLSNEAGEKVLIGYDKTSNSYFLDRTNSGKVSFEKDFAKRHTAPRFSSESKMDMTLFIDDASIELFADNGMTVMTQVFFPNTPYSNIKIESAIGFKIDTLQFRALKNIWEK
jgi:fructan beta-fructosidase